jgi:hypothetical protein
MAHESVRFEIDEDPDCYDNAVERNSILMGCGALAIAGRIRSDYRLSDRPLEFGQWNIEDFFDREMKAVEEAQRNRKEVRKQDISRQPLADAANPKNV